MGTASQPDSSSTASVRAGLFFAVASYIWWGISPFYFIMLKHVPPATILGHRIVWSIVVLAMVIGLARQWPSVLAIVRDRRLLAWLALSTVLVATNWLVFIYSIATERLIESSLGYFINPLVTVVLGMIFLGERLRGLQWIAAGTATAGVAYLTLARGGLPWIAIVLAVSFGFYSLIRKRTRVGANTGLFVETLFLGPMAMVYLAWSHSRPEADAFNGPATLAILSLAGIVTVAPLVWFVAAARRLTLVTIGFLQPLAPSIQFITAVFILGEPFDVDRFVAFALIWLAVGIFVGDAVIRNGRRRAVVVPQLE